MLNKIKITISTIIIPTDFSTVADNALRYGIDMAKQYNFQILLYHVVQLSTANFSHIVYVEDIDKIMTEHKDAMKNKMEKLKLENPNVDFEYDVEAGLLFDNLSLKCEKIKPIAVLMGITGSGALDKFIGSNAVLAIKHLPCPVMIIPKSAKFTPIKNICLACDLKNVLQSTPLLSIKVFTKIFNAKIHILNVDYKNKNFSAQTPEELQNLEYIFDDLPHDLHFVEYENVQNAITDFVDSENIDLLMMVPKKHTFFESLFQKSNSKEMAYETHIPILNLQQV